MLRSKNFSTSIKTLQAGRTVESSRTNSPVHINVSNLTQPLSGHTFLDADALPSAQVVETPSLPYELAQTRDDRLKLAIREANERIVDCVGLPDPRAGQSIDAFIESSAAWKDFLNVFPKWRSLKSRERAAFILLLVQLGFEAPSDLDFEIISDKVISQWDIFFSQLFPHWADWSERVQFDLCLGLTMAGLSPFSGRPVRKQALNGNNGSATNTDDHFSQVRFEKAPEFERPSFQFHGNYGGPGFTGGKFGGTDFGPKPVDKLDESFRRHDYYYHHGLEKTGDREHVKDVFRDFDTYPPVAKLKGAASAAGFALKSLLSKDSFTPANVTSAEDLKPLIGLSSSKPLAAAAVRTSRYLGPSGFGDFKAFEPSMAQPTLQPRPAIRVTQINGNNGSATNTDDHGKGKPSQKQVIIPTAPKKSKPTPKAFVSKTGTTIIRHREKVFDLQGSDNYHLAMSEFVNPANSSLFPWLSGIATSFDRYRFRKLKAIFVSTSSFFNGSSAAIGSVLMTFCMDAGHPNFTSSNDQEMYNTGASDRFVATGRACDDSSIELPGNVNFREYNVWTRGPETAVTSNVAKFQAGVYGMNGIYTIGKLYLDYEVELINPRLATPVQATTFSITGYATQDQNSKYFWPALVTGQSVYNYPAVGVSWSTALQSQSGTGFVIERYSTPATAPRLYIPAPAAVEEWAIVLRGHFHAVTGVTPAAQPQWVDASNVANCAVATAIPSAMPTLPNSATNLSATPVSTVVSANSQSWTNYLSIWKINVSGLDSRIQLPRISCGTWGNGNDQCWIGGIDFSIYYGPLSGYPVTNVGATTLYDEEALFKKFLQRLEEERKVPDHPVVVEHSDLETVPLSASFVQTLSKLTTRAAR